jgi:hypothetical protein
MSRVQVLQGAYFKFVVLPRQRNAPFLANFYHDGALGLRRNTPYILYLHPSQGPIGLTAQRSRIDRAL